MTGPQPCHKPARPKGSNVRWFELAGTTGLEPATSDVTGRRSNQLNYVPAILAPRICGARQVGDFQHNTCSRSATPA